MVYFRMLKSVSLIALVFLCVAAFLSGGAEGFASRSGPDGDCARCHTLTVKEADAIIKTMNPEVQAQGVSMGPVEGIWEVVIEARGKKGIAYIDFSKEHIITGSIIKLSTRENLTNLKLYDLSKIDPDTIPLDEALVLGKKDAKYKVIVFDDPD